MNTKRIAALVALSALLSTAAPALAVAPTGSVNVEWNYAITATMFLYTQSSASKTSGAPVAANDVYWASDPAGSVSSGCEGTTATASAGKDPTAATGTVNFGNVVADSTDYTDCMEINAVDAYVVTNDSLGGNLQAYISAGTPTNYGAANGSLICIYQANTWSTTANTAWAASGRSAAIPNNSMTSCANAPTGVVTPYMVGTTGPGVTLLALTKATTGSDYNQDLEVVLAPQTVSGQQNATLTYTFTTN